MSDHGTESRYIHAGCRCEACRAASAAARRQRRWRDPGSKLRAAAYKREWRRRRRSEGLPV